MISAEQRRLELSAVTMSLYLVPITSMRIVRLLTNTSYGNFFIIIGGDFFIVYFYRFAKWIYLTENAYEILLWIFSYYNSLTEL